MQTLPVTPVETLALAVRSASNGNPGIVPPWLDVPRNPGIVPPWLQHPVVGPDVPVGDDDPRIFATAAAQPTTFEPLPIVIDPDTPRIWPIG